MIERLQAVLDDLSRLLTDDRGPAPARAGRPARCLALDAEAATLVTYDPRLRKAAAAQGLFVALDDDP